MTNIDSTASETTSARIDNDSERRHSIAQARRQWSTEYVRQMQSLLGADACRRLAIYELPGSFCLSVIVPVYNEVKTIARVVERLMQTGMPMEIILVDDGSQDGTLEEMKIISASHEDDRRAGIIGVDKCIVCQHEKNQGKGAAVRTGIRAATGDVIVIQDADQEYDPTDFRYLLQPILRGEADVAYGTRYGHYDRQLSPWWHQAVNGFLSFLASLAIGIRLSDVETCYKMSRREHFQRVESRLKENRFGIEIELTAKFARSGLRFTERPIRYQHRWYDEGKKIGWRDGVSAIWCIVKYGVFRR